MRGGTPWKWETLLAPGIMELEELMSPLCIGRLVNHPITISLPIMVGCVDPDTWCSCGEISVNEELGEATGKGNGGEEKRSRGKYSPGGTVCGVVGTRNVAEVE